MIISRTQINIALESTIFPSNNQNHFGVSFVAHYAVNNKSTGFLVNACELNVLLFFKSSLSSMTTVTSFPFRVAWRTQSITGIKD